MKKFATTLFIASLALAPQGNTQVKDFNFEIVTLGGRTLTQDDFKNNVLIVDFWGTWCAPCRAATPMLKGLYGKYKHHGLEILGLAYEKVGKSEAQDLVRGFAAENGLTYALALGTSKIQNQVIGFQGYPTLLFFKRGLEFSHILVGHKPGHEQEIEDWVRKQIGLDKPKAGKTTQDEGEGEEKEEKPEEKENEEKEVVETGRIYKPGNHDQGFGFEVEGLDGKTMRFDDFRGRKVILAMTSTWDPEARNTAAVLNQLHDRYAKSGVIVLAASLEIARDQDKKVAAIKKFLAEVEPRYTVFPVNNSFLKKLHRTSGLPTYLMFDEKGTLILRQESDTAEKVLAAFAEALAGNKAGKGEPARKEPNKDSRKGPGKDSGEEAVRKTASKKATTNPRRLRLQRR